MKKIMFVIGGLANGGAERVVTSIASQLSKKEYDVSILTYYHSDNEYPLDINVKRINISGGDSSSFNKMSTLKKMKEIRRNITKYNPDEIICFLSNPSVYVFLATLFTKYNKRISFAVRANPKVDNTTMGKLQMKLSPFVKRLITQNIGQAECYKKVKESKKVVIPNPMYDELFLNSKTYSKEVSKIVSVGRLTDQKNYELAINAFEVINKKYPNIEYYIYGSGPLENKIISLLKDKELLNNVHIMGFEKDREVIYGDKDLFLMTSNFEGMPNALAEAMCKGIPVISTDCDFGPRDLILNEDMGILLKDYNVNTLVNSLDDVISNYEIYIEKAKNAKEILKTKYSYDKIINMWQDLIDENKRGN